MKEIVFDSFKSTLQEVKILNNIVVKEKIRNSQLEDSLKQAQNLLFSSYSSLNIFAESVKSYISVGYKITPFDKKEKKQISKIEAKIIYNKLLGIINSELEKDIIVPTESLILQSQISSLGLAFISASIDENLKKNNDELNIDKLKSQELSTALNKYFAAIIGYIQDILLYDIYLIFEKPEITYLQEIVFTTDYKKEYIDKWLDCTVTFNELRRNKRTDHWAEIYKLKLEFEQTEKIENHQKKLFDERIDFEIRNAINDFDELEDDVKKEALNKEIKLIQDFFNSDTSKTVVKRLKNIISFSKPKEVVLEYDNILRDRLLLSDFNVYEVGKSNYSSAFVASFFMQYLDKLKEYLESLNDEVNTNTMINSQLQYNDFKDLLLVEELEKRLAIEAVEYKTKIDELWQTYTFDPTYFDTFISGDLYNVFLNAIYERIKPLNDFEINKYLTLSVNQFKTHTPTKRAETFKRIYQATYWHPSQMEYKDNEHDDKYAMHVWKHYTNHFQLFKEATENALQDFKKGLIGNGRKQEVIEKPKTKTKSKHKSFTYINNITGQTQLTDLMNALKRKNLIDNSTDLKDFRKAFSGEAIDKPITWTGNISELSYFIKQLHNELKLVENLKQQQWAVTTNCFIQEDGKPFERSKFRGQKVPSTSKNIDSTLNTLK